MISHSDMMMMHIKPHFLGENVGGPLQQRATLMQVDISGCPPLPQTQNCQQNCQMFYTCKFKKQLNSQKNYTLRKLYILKVFNNPN